MSTSPIDDIENRIIEDDDNDFRKVTLTEKHIPEPMHNQYSKMEL